MKEDKSQYELEQENNLHAFREVVRTARPDIFVLMANLDETHVDGFNLIKVIRHMAQIANGSKYGQVHIMIENGIVTFVKGEEAEKIGTPVLK